jgi:hypothetical protein
MKVWVLSMIWVYINYEGVGTFNDLGLHKL